MFGRAWLYISLSSYTCYLLLTSFTYLMKWQCSQICLQEVRVILYDKTCQKTMLVQRKDSIFIQFNETMHLLESFTVLWATGRQSHHLRVCNRHHEQIFCCHPISSFQKLLPVYVSSEKGWPYWSLLLPPCVSISQPNFLRVLIGDHQSWALTQNDSNYVQSREDSNLAKR